MALNPWDDPIEKLQADYAGGLYEGRGIPSRLYQYAQQNPGAGIDRSGGNLAQDNPMFNFYNPKPGQTPGQDWWSTDDRNLPQTPAAPQIAQLPPVGGQQWQKDQIPAPKIPAGAPRPQASIRVMMPDGTEQQFSGIDAALNAALTGGGRILREDNTFASLRQFQGGWLADDKPLNVWLDQGWLPGQQEALNPTQQTPQTPATPQVPPGLSPLPQPVAPVGPGGNLGNQVGGQLNPNVPLPDLYNQLVQKIMASLDIEGRGLSPEAKAAMTTRAMEQVPAQFERLKQQLATQQLREGGPLPKGGGYFRQSGQLQADELATKFGLLRDVDLADAAEVARTREADRAYALQALGLAGQLTGQRGQYELGQSELGQRWDIAKLDAETRTTLAQMGITSNEKLAEFDANTRTKLAQMGIDSAEKLAGADNSLRRELTQMGIDSNLVLGKLDAKTRIDLMEMQLSGDKTGLRIAASLGSSVLANAGLMKSVVGGIKDIFGGGAPEETIWNAATGQYETISGKALGGLGQGKFGQSIVKFMKDPVTIAVAGAIAVGATWLKSQAHWEANSMVRDFENPFAMDAVIPMHDAFFKAAESGKLTKGDASLAIRELETMWADYKDKVREWSKGSSDKDLVANQSISGRTKSQGWSGAPNPGTLADTIARTLANMRQVEGTLT